MQTVPHWSRPRRSRLTQAVHRIHYSLARMLLLGVLAASLGIVGNLSMVGTALADVTNGGFEQPVVPDGTFIDYGAGDPSIPGWVIASGSVDVVNKNLTGVFPVHGGLQSLDLNGFGPGTIYQDVPTVEGHTYQLTFYLSGNPFCTFGVRTLTVTAGSAVASYAFAPDLTANPFGNQPFIREVLSFTGAAPSTRVQFASTAGDCAGPVLDDISVTEVNVDQIAPTSTATASPGPNANGWNRTDVTVALSATDNPGGSGVRSITFSASGAQTVASTTVTGSATSVTLSAEGTTTLSFFATDNAGNQEVAKTLTVRIDKTPPEAVVQFDRAGNLQVVGTDALSGVPAAPTLSTAVVGAVQTRTSTVTDAAGNTLVLVVQVKQELGDEKATLVSLQYNGGPVLTPTLDQEKFESVSNLDGSQTIEQVMTVGADEVKAEFQSATNQTTIRRGTTTVVRPGLVLLQLVTSRGQLTVQF